MYKSIWLPNCDLYNGSNLYRVNIGICENYTSQNNSYNVSNLCNNCTHRFGSQMAPLFVTKFVLARAKQLPAPLCRYLSTAQATSFAAAHKCELLEAHTDLGCRGTAWTRSPTHVSSSSQINMSSRCLFSPPSLSSSSKWGSRTGLPFGKAPSCSQMCLIRRPYLLPENTGLQP